MTTAQPIVDLHCHSIASDGTLSPHDVVRRAAGNGVGILALTDHDTTAGLDEAYNAARGAGIVFKTGIEISTTCDGKLLHIVGLDIDPDHPPLVTGMKMLRDIREQRAMEIGRRLEKAGFANATDEACRLAGDGNVTRTHFARFLIESGAARDYKDVFKRFLVRGKPGYYRVDWADLDDAVQWITGAGGVAVVAHPMRYKLTASWLNRILEAFRRAGGTGIEVITGNNTADDNARSAFFARKHGLLASQGSDFHEPGKWVELGKLAQMPADLAPVWQQWLDD
jgi:predicted metal-dependent phosphoesterase TrpH